jgi:hypothetical protein
MTFCSSPLHREAIVMSDLITRYLACWNESDPSARRALIEQHWSHDASYSDPLGQVRGRDGVDAVITEVQKRFPGMVFTPASPVDEHHRQARFTWGLGPDGAEPLIVGFDVVVLDDDGRFETVLGFLDKVPA